MGADHKAAADAQAGVPAPFRAGVGFAGPIVRRPTSAGFAARSGRGTNREAALQWHRPCRLVAADSSRLSSPLRGCGAALSRSKDASKAAAVHGGRETDTSLLPGRVRLAGAVPAGTWLRDEEVVCIQAACHIRARTGGKQRPAAVTHGQPERPLTWTRAGRPPARNELLSSGSRVRILPGALIFAPRNPWRQTVARAGCHSTLHTVFTSSASRPQVMLATLGYRQHPQAALQ